MNKQEARKLQRRIEGLLDGDEIALLRAEESEHIPDHWGVRLELTSYADWLTLADAAVRYRQKYPAVHKRTRTT